MICIKVIKDILNIKGYDDFISEIFSFFPIALAISSFKKSLR